MNRTLAALFTLALFFSSCSSKESKIKQRDDQILSVLRKYVHAVDSNMRIDSLKLTKVDTLHRKANLLYEYDDWDRYITARQKIDSLDAVQMNYKLQKAKLYTDISRELAITELDDAKNDYKKWKTKSGQTMSYLQENQKRYDQALASGKDTASLGYLVNFRLIGADRRNIEKKIDGVLRLSKSFSIIKTEVPDDLDSY